MVFNFKETIAGLHHLYLRWHKIYSGRGADYYLSQLRVSHPSIQSVKAGSNNNIPAFCPICGYTFVEIKLKNGFRLTTCSALDLPLVMANMDKIANNYK